MKQWLVLLLCLLATCCAPRPKSLVQEASTVDLMRRTVALVDYRNDDGDSIPPSDPEAERHVYCAGTWIGENLIATAEHCVHELGMTADQRLSRQIAKMFGLMDKDEYDPTGQKLFYSTYDDPTTPLMARVLAVDVEHDVALVRAKQHPIFHPVAGIAATPRVGDDVRVIGHPSGKEWSFIRGTVSAVRLQEESFGTKKDVIQINACIWFGNSGGAAFDAKGDLLGVTSYMNGAPCNGFFIEPHYLEEML